MSRPASARAASAMRPTRSRSTRPRVADVDRGQLRAGEREVVVRVDEAGQDRAGPRCRWPRHRAGAIARTAASPPTAVIRSPTIATPPLKAGSPSRAVKTRPLTRTSPRMAVIIASGNGSDPLVSRCAAGLRCSGPAWRSSPDGRALAQEEDSSMRRWTNRRRVPCDDRDRHRVLFGRRWRRASAAPSVGGAGRQLAGRQ